LALLDRWWEMEPELPDFFDFIDGTQPAAKLLTPDEFDVAIMVRAGASLEHFSPAVLEEIQAKDLRWMGAGELMEFLRWAMKQPGMPDEPDTGEEE
jgi:hypothetical protein